VRFRQRMSAQEFDNFAGIMDSAQARSIGSRVQLVFLTAVKFDGPLLPKVNALAATAPTLSTLDWSNKGAWMKVLILAGAHGARPSDKTSLIFEPRPLRARRRLPPPEAALCGS
jgi:hypothetical protein